MTKTWLWVRRKDRIEKMQGYILEGDYCACKCIGLPWHPKAVSWEVVDAKSGIVIFRERSLKLARWALEACEKAPFEMFKKRFKKEYQKCCEQIKSLNESKLGKEIRNGQNNN